MAQQDATNINVPVRTPMYPGTSDHLHWQWATFFDSLRSAVTGGSNKPGTKGATGLQGQTGVHGIDGHQGVDGQTGLQGYTGLSGLANFIQDGFPQPIVDPTLLWNFADEALYVGVTGVGNWVQVGNLGELGQTGIQGLTGIYGQTGIQGDTGILGNTGLQGPGGGDQGHTGLTGPTGIQGMTGVEGLQGVMGQTGIQGNTGVGLANFIEDMAFPVIAVEPIFLWNETDEALYAGVTGIAPNWVQISAGSEKGDQGIQGQTGIQGATGLYGHTGVQGNTGVKGLANWVESPSYPALGGFQEPILLWNETDECLLAGVTGLYNNWVQISAGAQIGATGLLGPTGIQGNTGVRGMTGIQGFQGVQGATGFYGKTGVQGIRGFTGLALGATGIQGQTGIQGVTGLALGATGIQGQTGLGMLESTLVNFTPTSTGVTNPVIHAMYSKRGRQVTFNFTLDGTATTTPVLLSLPHTADGASSWMEWFCPVAVGPSLSTAVGMGVIQNVPSSTLKIYPSWANRSATWSGFFTTAGNIYYDATS